MPKNVEFFEDSENIRSQTMEIDPETCKNVKRNRKIAKFSACGGPNRTKEQENVILDLKSIFFYILQKQIKKHCPGYASEIKNAACYQKENIIIIHSHQ